MARLIKNGIFGRQSQYITVLAAKIKCVEVSSSIDNIGFQNMSSFSLDVAGRAGSDDKRWDGERKPENCCARKHTGGKSIAFTCIVGLCVVHMYIDISWGPMLR